MYASAGPRQSRSWGGFFVGMKAIPLHAPCCLPQEAPDRRVAGGVAQVCERDAGAECQLVIKYQHRVTKPCGALQAQMRAGGGIARSAW